MGFIVFLIHAHSIRIKRKEKMCDIRDSPGHLRLRSEKYNRFKVNFRMNESMSAERQLGVLQSMCGGDEEEYIHLLLQSKELAGKVISSPFTIQNTEVIFREKWIMSMQHCLSMTRFPQDECDSVQRPY